ncbi:MAG: hypothetical protein J2P25_13385 [Nocardiopsaceae bacterium]|nr:hypothetical protein [Nocardiopsaceae bacterium]
MKFPSADRKRRPSFSGQNCTVVNTDVAGFGALQRNDRNRRIIRAAVLDMMRASLGRLWEECASQDQGDGLLLVVPPAIPTAKVMERLHGELPEELGKHNRTYDEPSRIRLRVAVTVGPIVSDPLGMSGEAIIRSSRLLDAPALKDAMKLAGASLGMIVSEFVHEHVIRHAEGWAGPGGYDAVEVNVKESHVRAWMQLIDPSPTAGSSSSAPVALS